MKKGIHPENYRLVVFKDISNEYMFMTKSTVESKETIQWEDGNEYPLVKLEISHTSHPFYTGKMKLVDTAGRVDKFRNRYQDRKEKQETLEKEKEEARLKALEADEADKEKRAAAKARKEKVKAEKAAAAAEAKARKEAELAAAAAKAEATAPAAEEAPGAAEQKNTEEGNAGENA